MSVLLDTNAISELRNPIPNPGLLSELARVGTENLYLSVITLGEIDLGVGLLVPGRKRSALEEWRANIERQYIDRILEVDRETARIWAEVENRRARAGRPISTADALIAATALRHAMTLVTRNTADFEETGVQILNPWT